ncbi:MAG TPA: PKD domain-containing protein [Bacteroidia bacterium]|nr:PKD domain-containing protein [Bacteroidia bacterium]
MVSDNFHSKVVRFAIILILFFGKNTCAQFSLAGTTAQSSCSCFRLTQAFGNQNGSLWNTTAIDLSVSFDFTFSIFAGCSDAGADGLVFTLQRNSLSQMGVGGGGIGYQGISTSLGIELDTYQNVWDPVNDHIAIIRNGGVDHGTPDNLAGPINALPLGADVEDCNYHDLRITWNAVTTSLAVYFDGSLRLTYTGNIVASIFGGNPVVYWGFVASTGGSVNEQRVCTSAAADFTASTNFEVCAGDPLIFSDLSYSSLNSINAWQWDFGDNTSAAIQSPTHTFASPGTYPVQLTITDPTGCSHSYTHNVIVHPIPALSVTPNAPSVCDGGQIQLDVSGASVYGWSPSSGLNVSSGTTVIATPSATTSYTVQGTTNAGCSSMSTVTVTVDPLPVLSLTNTSAICEGDTTVIQVSGAFTYVWEPDISLNSTSGPSVTALPLTTTTYTVTGTNAAGCTASASTTLTVNVNPVVLVSPSQSVCNGQSVSLIASGAASYDWSPASGLSSVTGAQVSAAPGVTTTYTVSGTTTAGCTGTNSVTLTVEPIPQVLLSADTIICEGSSAVLSSAGGVAYQWTPATGLSSPSDSVVTASPVTSTVYTVTVSGQNGCIDTASVLVTVLPLPQIQTSSAPTICKGQSVNISASGASTYSWFPAAGLSGTTGSTVTANPDTTTTYTIAGTLNGCSSAATIAVTVNPLPVLTVSPPLTICLNQSATLQASGAGSYSWSPATALSSVVGAAVTAAPLSSITYTVTGTTLGCSGTETIDVIVAPLLHVAVSPANPVICAGESIVLTAQGAGQYQWFPATGLSSTTNSITDAHPGVTTTYTVIGSSGACVDTSTFTLTVNPLPVVTLTQPPTICAGDTTLMDASGAVSYTWSPTNYLNVSSGTSVFAWPGGSTIYTVVGTSSGCRDTATVMLTVTPLPIVSVTGQDTICYGGTTALSAHGAGNYQWFPATGLNNGASATVLAAPLTSTVYTVTGTQLGCTSTRTVSLEVTPLPVIAVSPDITVCAGQSTPLFCTGADTYQWSPASGLDTVSGNSVNAAPVTTQTYTVTGTANHCSNTNSVLVTIVPVPQVTVPPDQFICDGNSIVLNANGAMQFMWEPTDGLNADTGSGVVASPAMTTTYTVTGISAGCSDTATVTVGIIPLPVVSVSADTSICQGQTAGLFASGANTYLWSPPTALNTEIGNHVLASPAQTTTYNVSGQSNGCSASAGVTVFVNPLPIVQFTPNPVSGCQPLTVTFRNAGSTDPGSVYSWILGDTIVENSSAVTYTFNEAGTYTVKLTVTSPDHCVASLSIPAVSVFSFPEALFALSPDITTILDPVIQLTDLSTDAATWNWSFGDSSPGSSEQNPSHQYSDTGTFFVKLIVENIHGCADTITGIVRVNEDYAFYIPNSFSPNADGINDIFKPLGIGVHGYELFVFDRWGEQVFHSKDKLEGWTGEYNGNPCPEGVYVYKLKTLDPAGNPRDYAGHITLIH